MGIKNIVLGERFIIDECYLFKICYYFFSANTKKADEIFFAIGW